jgi:electron transport complex protein RnfC
MHLLPQQLYWFARAKNFDKVQDYNLFDCIECGCCAYVCPSRIPLVHYYRYAKTEIWALERDRQRAEAAKRRHTSRVERLEQDEREREARLAQKKKVAAHAAEDPEQVKKAAVQAAIARARAKQAGETEGTEPP